MNARKDVAVKDDLGDRMKLYEMAEAGRKLLPLLPALARLDGRAFHQFTRDMERPFDSAMSRMMIDTARWLAQETVASMVYTQSDEITLAWLAPRFDSQIFFDGRIQKMCSVLAALATAYFNRLLLERLPALAERLPVFDCRVWNVPNTEEAANTFLWREKDATKNSVAMAARHYYPHEELESKSGSAMQELLWQKGVNWNDYPAFFKRGVFIQRRTVRRPFTIVEIEQLPPMHEARRNPELVVERQEYVELDMPPFGQVTNRVEVIFAGAEPQVAAKSG
jgi:tRNA(His) 5'-end guanylyltransferase